MGLPSFAAEADDNEDEASEDGDVEEVLVTGSFIRRDNFDLPSPKNVIDSEDIALSGNAEIGDVIFDQSFKLKSVLSLIPWIVLTPSLPKKLK